ncbi:MAG: ABC transporter substrate-binding protein [Deltaproteobacteria bacterium]|nr:ABC transporter substrate-binding protein [Deltaproteobacteria bacterium]MBW2383328.1 ABC transporter substrate-binding protein [Deltaproteobacteria bacterium]
MHRPIQLLGALGVALLAGVGAARAQDVAAVGPEVVAEAAAEAEAEISPITTVETLHAGLYDIMKRAEALGFEGRFEIMRPVVGETFDLGFMSSKVVGRKWKHLTSEQQQIWHDKFQRYLCANYAGNFSGHDGEVFETLGVQEAPRETQVVLTKLNIPGSEDVVLNYRLRQVDGEWLIIDIYLKGTVSELALRRSDFSSILKEKGFPELTAAVDKKIADLRRKAGG